MNRFAYTTTLAAVAVLIVGCADIPQDPESQRKLHTALAPVQANEPGDTQLDCATLTEDINQMKWDLSALDLQLKQAQNTSTGFAVLGALAGLSGAYATNLQQVQNATAQGVIANTGGAFTAADGMNKSAIRGTYQARYDALVSDYNIKGCPRT